MSARTKSNSELISEYLDVMRRDASVVDGFFAPDVEYLVNGTPQPDPAGALPPISADCLAALPCLGLHRGRVAVKGFLAHMHRNLEVTAFWPAGGNFRGKQSGCLWLVPPPRASDRSDGGHRLFDFLRAPRRPDCQISLPRKHLRCCTAFRASGSRLIRTDGETHEVPPHSSNKEI